MCSLSLFQRCFYSQLLLKGEVSVEQEQKADRMGVS